MKKIQDVLKDERGFHCCRNDLMIVVALIGILAAVAIPKLGELIEKSQAAHAPKPAAERPAARTR